jgi:hypothetical protein
VFESHIDPLELDQKITALFNYRLFPEIFAIDTSMSDAQKSLFWNHLKDLQTAIYHLDAHLEAHWQLDENKLKFHWDNIRQCLSTCSIDVQYHDDYLSYIRRYEKHERSLRQGSDLSEHDMEYFYYYKSCDVKLIRRLIYERLELGEAAATLSDWRYYDLITEVNDDIEDIFEDLEYINGNLCLIIAMTRDIAASKSKFVSFIHDIRDQATDLYGQNKSRPYHDIIFTLTTQRIDETLILLDEVIHKLSPEQLHGARLFPHLGRNTHS